MVDAPISAAGVGIKSTGQACDSTDQLNLLAKPVDTPR